MKYRRRLKLDKTDICPLVYDKNICYLECGVITKEGKHEGYKTCIGNFPADCPIREEDVLITFGEII